MPPVGASRKGREHRDHGPKAAGKPEAKAPRLPLLTRIRQWLGTTSGLAALGALLYWASLPPLDLWPLAWIAAVPWVVLVRRETIDARRPYLVLWLAAFAMWMGVLHWLRLPYWATSFGWVALSVYLAIYLPLFVALSRVAVHRLRVPVVVAVPVVWAGLELARAHGLSGFSMGALSHSQYRWITLIQISDLGGAYAVDFLILLVAACLARMLPLPPRSRVAFWPLVPAAAAIAATLVYGTVRTAGTHSLPGARVALIQGSIDIELNAPRERSVETFRQYCELSGEAIRRYPQADLLVWPETVIGEPLIEIDPDAKPPHDWPAEIEFLPRLKEIQEYSRALLEKLAGSLERPMIVGLGTHRYGPDRVHAFNSAAYLDASGRMLARYDKNHPVMFGEYVPFAYQIPWLQQWFPSGGGLDFGDRPAAFQLGSLRLAPNICYETVLSHVIRGLVNRLTAVGEEPDVLVNLTNDGWFWGSSQLDLHLMCGVFRAVECRKPLLIAANTGFSAWIDADGRIRRQGPRRDTGVLLAEVERDTRASWYLTHGDLPAGACLGVCLMLAVVGWWVGSRR